MSNTNDDEFLFIPTITNSKKRPKPPGGYSDPIIENLPFDDPDLSKREKQSIEEQFNDTTMTLRQKIIKEGSEIFYEIYLKPKISHHNTTKVLDGLNSNVIGYLDHKYHGLIISGPMEKLEFFHEKILKNNLPKYLKDNVRIVKPITENKQIDNAILNVDGVQMLLFLIMPNLDDLKKNTYVRHLNTFFNKNNCRTYYSELHKLGFILADVTYKIAYKLLKESTFVFKINLIPKGVAHELREHSYTSSSNHAKITSKVDDTLSKIVLLDSGVNPIPQLNPILVERDSFINDDPDDHFGDNGHGTPIANLIAFGDAENNSPIANIISYKIWSDETTSTKSRAFPGMFAGIIKYTEQSRLFISSIGIPDLQDYELQLLDQLIQHYNICFVAAAGNIPLGDIEQSLISQNSYPDYLTKFPVMRPASALNIVAVGSIANNIVNDKNRRSLAQVGEVSPHSRCGTYGIFDCKKPQVVEPGGNVNICDYVTDDEGTGVDTINNMGNHVSLSGTSFSAPLFIRKLSNIENCYKNQISNAETLLAISYLSCTPPNSFCAGYGIPRMFSKPDHNSAVFVTEDTMIFPQITDTEIITTTYDIIIPVPKDTVKIKFCICHSDDLYKSIRPTLETNLIVNVTDISRNNSTIIRHEALNDKTNVKILEFTRDITNIQSKWKFSLKPKIINDILSKDKRDINIRFGCAILLERKNMDQVDKSLTKILHDKIGSIVI